MTFIYHFITLNAIISDMVDKLTEGVKWGNRVAIALTASLLAISLIRYLFDRN